MTKRSEIVGAFAELIEAPTIEGHFWFAALKLIAFVGFVGGLMLLGAAAAHCLGLLTFPFSL